MQYVTNNPSRQVYQYSQVYPCRQACCCRPVYPYRKQQKNNTGVLLLAAGLLLIPLFAWGWGGLGGWGGYW